MSCAELEGVDAGVATCEVDEELVVLDPPHELAIMITTTSSDPIGFLMVPPPFGRHQPATRTFSTTGVIA